MATKSLLLVPVAICLLLLILPAAHGQQEQARVFLGGIARCVSNPSKIITNAPLEVSINGNTLVTGETTATGQFLLVGNVSSTDQLTALLSNGEAIITAPPQACGGSGTARDYVMWPQITTGLVVKTLLDDLEVYDLMPYDFMNKINDLLNIPVTV